MILGTREEGKGNKVESKKMRERMKANVKAIFPIVVSIYPCVSLRDLGDEGIRRKEGNKVERNKREKERKKNVKADFLFVVSTYPAVSLRGLEDEERRMKEGNREEREERRTVRIM